MYMLLWLDYMYHEFYIFIKSSIADYQFDRKLYIEELYLLYVSTVLL